MSPSPLPTPHTLILCSGIIGGCVALGNLSGAFLGVGHEAMGRTASYITVYALLFVATLTTGVWLGGLRLRRQRSLLGSECTLSVERRHTHTITRTLFFVHACAHQM